MTKTGLAVCLLLLTTLPAAAAADDVIQAWNRVLADVFQADAIYQNPGMASRSLAMTNIAMYDAVQSVTQTHQTFYTHSPAPSGAASEAAALRAGYEVVSSIYPAMQSEIDTHYNDLLSSLPNNAATAAGLTFGQSVGATVVQQRQADGYMDMVSYSPTYTVGNWQPDPLNPSQVAWGPEWGEIETFGIPDSAFMMPAPMPAMTSQQYTDAFNEVKELGSVDSATRTADQTEIGLFWAYDRVGMGTPMRMYLQVLDKVASGEGNSLEENARLYAMASTSVADAGIVAWDAKFQYDYWRPISGIRQADLDGNPDTVADPDWVPLGSPGGSDPDFTPPFPTYISGHASFGGALFQAMENFYGTDDISFSLTSDELPGVTRDYESFSQAMVENGRSRVYLGIHWNFDDEVARIVGADVANHVSTHYFQPIPEPSGWSIILVSLLGAGALRKRKAA